MNYGMPLLMVVLCSQTSNITMVYSQESHLGNNQQSSTKKRDLVLEDISIERSFSIYEQSIGRHGRRKYAISDRVRTFLPRDSTNVWGEQTDYSDLINITNKLAQRHRLLEYEISFLKLAKPVFSVSIRNGSTEPIMLKAIILKIKSIDEPMGGGMRTERPGILFQLDVPTKKGTFRFPVQTHKPVISSNSIKTFFLLLNSTNKKILTNRVEMYPQLDYVLSIGFDFGESGQIFTQDLEVLL